MSANKLITPIVLVVMATVAGLAALMVAIDPTRAVAAVVAGGFLPASWLVLRTLGPFFLTQGDVVATCKFIRVSMVGAGLVLAVSLATKIGQTTGLISTVRWDVENLVFGFTLAVALVVMGWAAKRANSKR